jgi:hypothetical protein
MAEEGRRKRKPPPKTVDVGGKRIKPYAPMAGTRQHTCDCCIQNDHLDNLCNAIHDILPDRARELGNALIQDHKPQIHNAGALVQCRLPRQEGKYNACDTIWFLNCFKGNLGVLQHICNCDTDNMDRFSRIGNTSICYAIAGSVNGHNLAVVKWLVNGYMSSSKEHTADMMTCLLNWTVHCAGLGDIQILQFFTEQCKESNMEVRDSRGYTPLLTACLYGNKHAVKFLQEYCKMGTVNNDGDGMVAVAVKNGRFDLLQWMLDDPSHGSACLVTAYIHIGMNVFHEAVFMANESSLAVLEWLLSLPPKYVVASSITPLAFAETQLNSSKPMTPFGIAVHRNNLPAAKLLYEQHRVKDYLSVLDEWLLTEGYRNLRTHPDDATFKWLVDTFPFVLETACMEDLDNSSESVRHAYYELLYRRHAKPYSLPCTDTENSVIPLYDEWNEDIREGEKRGAVWRGFMLSQLSRVRQPVIVSELILQYVT